MRQKHYPDGKQLTDRLLLGGMVVIVALLIILAVVVYRFRTLQTVGLLQATPDEGRSTLPVVTQTVSVTSTHSQAATSTALAAAAQQAAQATSIAEGFAAGTQSAVVDESINQATAAQEAVRNAEILEGYEMALRAYHLAPTIESVQALFAAALAPRPPREISLSTVGNQRAVRFSPDHTMMMVSRDDYAELRSMETGEVIREMAGTRDWGDFEYNLSGRRLYSRYDSTGTSISIWDTETGQQIADISIDVQYVEALLSADGTRLLVSTINNELEVRDAVTGELINTIRPFREENTFDFYVTSDNRYVVTSQLRADLWDLQTGEFIRNLQPESDGVTIATFDPLHQRYVDFVDFSQLQITSLDVSQPSVTFNSDAATPDIAPVFSPDGHYLAVASLFGRIEIWTVQGELVHIMGGAGDVDRLRYSADGTRLISLDAWAVRVWDTATGLLLQEITDTQGVGDAFIMPDNSTVVTYGNNTLRWWQPSIPGQVWDITSFTSEQQPTLPAFSLNGSYLAAVRPTPDQATADIWLLDSEQRRFPLQGHTAPIHTLRYSSDGLMVFTASEDGTVRCWNAQTGEAVWQIATQSSNFFTFDVSPDGEQVLTVIPEQNLLQVWDTDSGSETWRSGSDADPGPYSAYFSSDGLTILAAEHQGGIWLLDAQTGVPLRRVGDINGWGQPILPSPDFSKLAVLGSDTSLWDLASGERLADLNRIAIAGSFDDSGSLLVTYEGNMVTIWNVATGEVRHQLEGHEG